MTDDRPAPGEPRWLEAERERLTDFALRSRLERGGFGWQGDDGAVDPDGPAILWITCRMTHVFALAVLEGKDGYAGAMHHGVTALRSLLRDTQHGGWFSRVGPNGPEDLPKSAYDHVFVVLAASSALAAGDDDARALLDDALDVVVTRFLRPEGLLADEWDAAFTRLDPYRGVNANMHAVEAFLAAYDAAGDGGCLERAATITDRVVRGFAARNGWRLPEHFDERWQPLLDYNRDTPAHPFRPFGATIGHAFEWARLCLHLRAAQAGAAPAWLLESAESLYAAAVRDGWNVDGATGFVYTVDWDGTPVVRQRMHWVAAEAVAAAAVLEDVTGRQRYRDDAATWWQWIDDHLVDREHGSWHHELDAGLRSSSTVWTGKPDVYHAVQATLVPRIPLAASLAGGVRRRPG